MSTSEKTSNSFKMPKLQTRWYEAHSLAGVLALIPLFIIIVTGTISFYQHELIAWHIPEARVKVCEPLTHVDHLTVHFIHEVPQDVKSLLIEFPNEHFPLLTAEWSIEGDKHGTVYATNPSTGELIDGNAVSSEFAHHLFLWHFLRPLPLGLTLSGLLSLVWVALTVSGTYIHRKKLISQFKDGWKRSNDRSWQSWLHSIIGTVTLPFHLIYGITGAIFGLGTLALPLVLFIAFDGDQRAMQENLTGFEEPAQATGNIVEQLPALDPFIERTLAEAPGAEIGNMFIEFPYDEAALMHIHFTNKDGETGEAKFEINRSQDPIFFEETLKATPAIQVLTPALLLHFGSFGGIIVKLFYTAMGLSLCLLTYAGTRLWIYRQQRKMPRWSMMLDRLFDGFGLGCLPAIGIYAWANRLLPTDVADRGHIEILIFHGSWMVIGLVVLAFGTGKTHRRMLMHLTVALITLIPVLDGLLYQAWPWQANSWHVASVGITNITLLAIGAVWFGLSIWRRPSINTSRDSKKGRRNVDPFEEKSKP